MKVCIIGLGHIGFPVAQYACDHGLKVWGYDINTATVEKANETGQFTATTFWNEIPPVDVYIVCVTTTQCERAPDLSPVFEVCKKIAETAEPSAIVSIESTITPGTCRKIFESIFKTEINLVHAPHRYWAGDPVNHGVNQLRVIGAVNKESLDVGVEFYQETLGIKMHVASSAEVAEMCKITENSHRYLQIAFAEELKMICQEIGLNFDELREAMNTKWNVELPEARDGIGGHCLPKDILYVISLAPSHLLESALNVDKQYREWLSKQ
jgi:nucleotide sugar dehydrogenase